MDIKLPPDFRDFLKLLKEHQVEYLLIGGYAVGYHGYPRATNDLDIWIAIHSTNAVRMVNALWDFGFDMPQLTEDLFLQGDSIVRMGVAPIKIEVATTISGVVFEECYAERVVDMLDEVEVNIINLPHLKANKKASGRFKDLADLENLP